MNSKFSNLSLEIVYIAIPIPTEIMDRNNNFDVYRGLIIVNGMDINPNISSNLRFVHNGDAKSVV